MNSHVLVLSLKDLMEKTIVFALATGQKRFSDSLCKLVEKYSEILASQGLLTTAMEYLNLLGTEELSTEITILRDRIARSTEPGLLCYFIFICSSYGMSPEKVNDSLLLN